MIQRRSRQTIVFLTGLLLIIVLHSSVTLGLWGQILILAPAVALLGLPHGALDPSMAEVLWPFRGRRDRAVFFAGYLTLAGGIALLWWVAPGVGLATFLAYSAFHFSGDWQSDGRTWRWAGGLSAIGAPALFHPVDVAAIFAMLGPTDSASAIAAVTGFAGCVGLALAVYSIVSSRNRMQRCPVAELSGIWIGAAILPPLLYFVVYFCLLHSLRHFVATIRLLPDRRRALRHSAAIMAISVVGAALGLAVLLAGSSPDIEAAVLQVVFIGLAALTVPHMLLVERFHQKRDSDRSMARSV